MNNPFDIIMEKLNNIELKIESMPVPVSPLAPEIINTKELCKRLGITEPTAIRWRKKGKIPYLQFGAVVRYNWPKVIERLNAKNK